MLYYSRRQPRQHPIQRPTVTTARPSPSTFTSSVLSVGTLANAPSGSDSSPLCTGQHSFESVNSLQQMQFAGSSAAGGTMIPAVKPHPQQPDSKDVLQKASSSLSGSGASAQSEQASVSQLDEHAFFSGSHLQPEINGKLADNH